MSRARVDVVAPLLAAVVTGASVALVLGVGVAASLAIVAAAAVLVAAARSSVRAAMAVVVGLAATALLVMVLSLAPSQPTLPSALVVALWLAASLVAAVVVGRRGGARAWPTRTWPTDLSAAAAALAWAVWFHGRAAGSGRDAVLLLVGSDDNAAWVDAAARSLLGGSVPPTTVHDYGPVLSTVVAATSAVGGPAAVTVVRVYGLLVVAALVVPVLLARRARGRDTGVVAWQSWLTWLTAAVLLATGCLFLGTRYGFLSAALLLVLAVAAVGVLDVADVATGDPGATRPPGRAAAAGTAAALAAWAACSSWLGAVPAGVVALLLLGAVAVVGARRSGAVVGAAAPVVAVAVLAPLLVLQWARVAPGAGGASGLLDSRGEVPATEPLLVLLALGAVVAACATDRRGRRPGALAATCLLVGSYAAVVVGLGWATTGGSGYAAQKLTFLAVLLCTLLGAAAVTSATPALSSARPLRLPAAVSGIVLLVVVGAGSQVASVVATAWPRAVPAPVWLDAGLAAVRPGQVVGCLPDPRAAVDRSGSPLDAYWCTRWLSSIAAADGPTAVRWRAWLLGLAPESDVVDDLRGPGRPTTVVVLGPGGADRLGTAGADAIAGGGVRVVPVVRN